MCKITPAILTANKRVFSTLPALRYDTVHINVQIYSSHFHLVPSRDHLITSPSPRKELFASKVESASDSNRERKMSSSSTGSMKNKWLKAFKSLKTTSASSNGAANKEAEKLRAFENKVLRKIFWAKRDEVTGVWRKLHNTELHALYSPPDIIRNIKSRRLRWAGHVARMGESRNAYRVLIRRPEGKRPLGRPKRRWEDNIKMDLREVGYDGRDWVNLAQDRAQWRAYVNPRVP
ncbi:hypothetical protein ANN_01747 [Periplaneta americana]|uniref:Uncharacterized protein n=1 Tax=Periplaneta americana TaxID=6978 RepID=A0ABQ8TUD9_PERAM|nr:hypothetical protein ANN_01747 [Periplaneta americana]